MNWSVRVERSAFKNLSRITKFERLRLMAAIDGLPQNPYRGSALKGELTGSGRIRVGAFRVIYEIRENEAVILVISAGRRQDT